MELAEGEYGEESYLGLLASSPISLLTAWWSGLDGSTLLTVGGGRQFTNWERELVPCTKMAFVLNAIPFIESIYSLTIHRVR